MGSADRAYNIMRAYVNSEWNRLFVSSEGYEAASRELDSYPKIVSAKSNGTSGNSQVGWTEDVFDVPMRARTILGVGNSATFPEIKAAYQKLMERSQPGRFETDSTEAFQAEQIRRRVQEAYEILAANADPTERRFSGLEVE